MFLGGGEQIGYRTYAEATQRLIDEEVSRLLGEAEERALKLLTGHRDQLDRLTQLLLEEETVDGEDVYRIADRPVPGGQPQILAPTAQAAARVNPPGAGPDERER